MLKLAEKSFQTAIITIFKDVKKGTLKVIEQRETISRKLEILIKNQIEMQAFWRQQQKE